MLCGDEVHSVIADIGNAYSRFGSAGQDTPRHVFGSNVGYRANAPNRDNLIGESALSSRSLSDVDVMKPLNGAGDINWDCVEGIIKHGIVTSMRLPLEQSPVLFAESFFENPNHKESLLELCFETLDIPAVYMCSGATLSSFSTGRPTSLVIDMGASETRISPVVDGYVLKNAVVKSRKGGNLVDQMIRKHVASQSDALKPLKPFFEYNVESTKIDMKSSVRDMNVDDVARDIKKWCCFVPYKPMQPDFRVQFMQNLPMPAYELPDGAQVLPCDELCTIPEQLWFAAAPTASSRKRIRSSYKHGFPAHMQPVQAFEDDGTNTSSSAGSSADGRVNPIWDMRLHELVYTSAMRCDVDSRRDLFNNLLLTGGGAGIDGVGQRLTYELTELLATNLKVKLVPSLPIEKQFSAWIGGSILAICGSFQQLWVSAEEYAEKGGAAVVNDKFIH